jgi:cold-inducible RNA-binding protein
MTHRVILKANTMGKKLYIGNLSPEANEASLKALFSMFGAVEKAYVIPDPQTGKGKGYGFVVMSSEAEAQAAIKALDGKKCGDYTVKVELTKGKG